MNIESMSFSSLVAMKGEVLKELGNVKNYLDVLNDLNEKGIISEYDMKANVLIKAFKEGEYLLFCIDRAIQFKLSEAGFKKDSTMYDMVTESISRDLKKYKDGLHKRV